MIEVIFMRVSGEALLRAGIAARPMVIMKKQSRFTEEGPKQR